MKRSIKQVLIGTGTFFCLVLLLFSGTVLYFKTDHAQNLLQRKINGQIPGTLSYEKLRFSLLKGELELKNFLLEGPSYDRLAGFGRLFMNVSWTRLLKGDLTVERLVLERPWATIRHNEKGEMNLISAFPSVKAAQEKPERERKPLVPLNIIIDSLQLLDGSITYEKDDEAIKALIQNLVLTAQGDLSKQSGNLTVQTMNVRLGSPKIQTMINQLQIKATFNKDCIDPFFVQMNTASSELMFSGYISDLFSNPVVDIEMNTLISLSEVRQMLSLGSMITGRVSIHMNMKGQVSNPYATCRVTYGGGTIFRRQVDRIDLDVFLKDRLVILKSLNADIASGHLEVNGEADLKDAFMNGFLSHQREIESISYSLFLNQDAMRLGEILPGLENLKGIVSCDLSLDGRGISPDNLSAKLEMQLFAKEVRTIHDASPIDIHLKSIAYLDKGVVSIRRIDVETDAIKVHGEGLFDLTSYEVRATLVSDLPNLAEITSAFTMEDIQGQLELRADISGSIKTPIIDCFLQGYQLRYEGVTIGDIHLDAVLDSSGRVSASLLELENQDSAVRGAGWIQMFTDSFKLAPSMPLNFSFLFNNLQVVHFLEDRMINGTADGQLRLTGSVTALEADLSLRGKGVKVEAARIGDLVIDLRFSGGKLFLDTLKLHNRSSSFHASGTAQVIDPESMTVSKDPAFHLDLQGKRILLEDFLDHIKGRFSIDIHCKGTVKEPVGTINLHGKNIDLGVQKLSEIRLKSRLDRQKVWFAPFVIDLDLEERIEASGWISTEEAFQMTLISEGFSLHNIDWVRDRDIGDGKIALRISGKGTFNDPEIEGEISLSEMMVQGKALDNSLIRLDLHDHLARIQGGVNFDFQGSFHLKEKGFSLSLLLDETDLHPYLEMANLPLLTGTATGRVDATGNMEAMDRVSLHADMSKMKLFFKGKEIMRTQDFNVSVKEGQFHIPVLHVSLAEKGWVDVQGQGELDGPLSIGIKGRIPLETARPFFEDFPDVMGDILLFGTIEGTRDSPRIEAEVDVKNVSLIIPYIPQRLNGLNGRILISPEAITIDGLMGKIDTGRFVLEGRVDMDKFQPVKVYVNLDANAVPLELPDMLKVLFNTELKIHGDREKSMMEGELIVLEGTYFKDVKISLISLVPQKKREEPLPPKEIMYPLLRNMGLNISVKRRNPFLVDNNLAILEITPDLHISGNIGNPVMSGRANIDTGTINYQKKTFVVKKGVIDFINPYKIEPVIDITSEVQIRNWMIFLEISGTPDELVLKLTSDPAEEDEDILSLLLLGKTAHEVIEGEGGTAKTTEQLLAELIASTFGEDIKRAAGIDILEVETQDEEGEEASDRIKVTVGKNLSRRMTVKYATETKDGEISQRAIAEYKFLENIYMNGFQDSRGMFGGVLRFKVEFR
ncbi:MAG: translocation/assembly module TamB domain-containing protein [Thermodesulfobacteriota bacterium]|nr:translocation/assembly module TamB domain-containing protein [Thermodesulfobacteriota bacterium]